MAAMNDPNLFFLFLMGLNFQANNLSEGYFLTVVANIYIVSIELFSFFRDWHYGIDSMLEQG